MENYREFNNTELEQLVGKVVKHKQSKDVCLVIQLQDNFLIILSNCSLYAPALLTQFEFLDGTPCGVKKEKTFNIMELDVNKKYKVDIYNDGIWEEIEFNSNNIWINSQGIPLYLSPLSIQAKFIEL